MKELIKVRDDLQQENAAKETKAKQDQERIQEMHAKMAELKETMAEKDEEAQSLRDNLASKQAEQEREARRKERLDKELHDMKAKLEAKGEVEAKLREDQGNKKAQITQMEKQLNEARTTMEKYLRDYDTLYQRTQKLTVDLDEKMYHNSQLAI